MRLVVDGKTVASDGFHSSRNGIKIAVVTGQREVAVYVEVDHEGVAMQGYYREIREDNVSESQYFGSGTNLVLKGWTQIYGLSQSYIGMGGKEFLYDLRVEIKADTPYDR